MIELPKEMKAQTYRELMMLMAIDELADANHILREEIVLLRMENGLRRLQLDIVGIIPS